MSWFFWALICLLGWGWADVFYKKGTVESDRYSHLRQAVWVGLVMGVCSLALLPFSESGFSLSSLVKNAAAYSPASLSYIVSMVIGYAGLRYLELSIVSPVQNASGALSAIAMIVFFLLTGHAARIADDFSLFDIVGTGLIVAGALLLAYVENRQSRAELALNPGNKRFVSGAGALIFPFLYCVFDTIGTAADGIILDEEAGLGLGEIDVLILYGLTFLLAGLVAWVFLLIREKRAYNPFAKTEKWRATAAVCEEFGQIFYVFAMAKNPVLAAPMVASYCIVSVVLSRLLLKEKLSRGQQAAVITVIAGIVLLGIAEGLAEA